MKKRNGFVSNSSSSSFIVAFPKNINSLEEFKKIVLGNCSIDEFVDSGYRKEHSGEEAIYILYTDYSSAKNLEATEIEARLKYSHYLNCNGNEECMKRLAKKEAEDFVNENSGDDIKIFCYSDNDGEGYLEHSDVFYNLPHIEISNH